MNPIKSIKSLTKFEAMLWIGSVIAVAGSYILGSGFDIMTLITSLIGVTALIFISKGDALGQMLIVIFSIGYGIISWNLRYYGEMITYMCMTAPIAAMSAYTWIKNPHKKGENQVKVAKPNKKQIIMMIVLTALTTWIFYYILRYFDTANLELSTISIATSFIASYLMLIRSEKYALGFGMNDIVLILLWISATLKEARYLPMVICFAVFLINDIYGYINWRRIKKQQESK